VRPGAAASLRGTVVVLAVAGLVVGAGRLEVPLVLHPPVADEVAAPGEETALVRTSALACPGPEQQGLVDPTVPEQPQEVTVAGVTVPAVALPDEPATGPGGDPARRTGELSLVPTGDDASVTTGSRGERVSLDLREAEGALVLADGVLAPGLAAGQWHLSLDEQRRGMTATPCTVPAEESWLVAGGGEAGRVERLVLVNPATDPVTVQLQVLGGDGTAETAGGESLVVPGGGRVVTLIDALAPGLATPVVRVTSEGGPVSAFLGDRWLQGSTDRGLALTSPTLPPSPAQLVPGVRVAEGEAGTALRVAVPGPSQAVVQVRALTPSGPVRVQQDVTLVPGGRTQDIQLSDLPAGAYALEVVSDEPVVAGATSATSSTEDGVADLAWAPASPPVTGLAGAPLPDLEQDWDGLLQLASTAGGTTEVLLVRADGEVSVQQEQVEPDTTAEVPVGDATSVWVRPLSGEVSAALLLGVTDDGGDLSAVVPLRGLPLVSSLTSVAPARP
jgi:hypothetical protein